MRRRSTICGTLAGMAELVDALDSKSSSGNRVGVRFPLPAPRKAPLTVCHRAFTHPAQAQKTGPIMDRRKFLNVSAATAAVAALPQAAHAAPVAARALGEGPA